MRRFSFVYFLALAACSSSTSPRVVSSAAFDVQVSGEIFRVQVETAQQAATLRAHMLSGRVGVLSGELVAGDGGFNMQWGWHLRPSTVETPDLSIELCDGRPSMVEADLPYWIGTVRRFCPWGARVVAEVLQ
ncbi:MAG: BP74-related protein [Gemmatimonadota bacterium]